MKKVWEDKSEIVSYKYITLAFRRKTMTVIVAENCKNAVSLENYLSVSAMAILVVKFLVWGYKI